MKHFLLTGAATLFIVMAAAPLGAQNRIAACITANDNVTRMRLGKDRQGRPYPVNVSGAVAAGRAAFPQCRGDSAFMLAYALARVDLASDTRRSTPAARNAVFTEAVADLETVRAAVMAGRSDRYEIFNILALIYYDTRQYDKSVAVANSGTPFIPRMSATSRQNTFVTKGMAQAQLGQAQAAQTSFRQSGAPQASAIQQKMLGK